MWVKAAALTLRVPQGDSQRAMVSTQKRQLKNELPFYAPSPLERSWGEV